VHGLTFVAAAAGRIGRAPDAGRGFPPMLSQVGATTLVS
jgi:hypothetical protein